MNYPAPCKNEGQRMSFWFRAEYRSMLDQMFKVQSLSPAEYEIWERGIFFPRHDRITTGIELQCKMAMNREYINGPPPFVIDLAHADSEIINPPGLNLKNEGSVLTHRYGLKGLHAEANPFTPQTPDPESHIIEWWAYVAAHAARHGKFWDVFINLEDM